MLAQEPGGTKLFIPSSERHVPEDKAFTVELRLFTVSDQQRFANRGGKKPGTLMRQILGEGVIGWDNLFREVKDKENAGKRKLVPVHFEGPESLDYLPLRVRREIADALMDLNEVDEDDEGN
jgi:hypothetical protein